MPGADPPTTSPSTIGAQMAPRRFVGRIGGYQTGDGRNCHGERRHGVAARRRVGGQVPDARGAGGIPGSGRGGPGACRSADQLRWLTRGDGVGPAARWRPGRLPGGPVARSTPGRVVGPQAGRPRAGGAGHGRHHRRQHPGGEPTGCAGAGHRRGQTPSGSRGRTARTGTRAHLPGPAVTARAHRQGGDRGR
jgi:hypothetical protein